MKTRNFLCILSLSIVFMLLTACAPTTASAAHPLVETTTPAILISTATTIPTQLPTSQPIAMELPTVISSPAVSAQDKAHYISETYPDGSNVAPQTTFQKSWKLQNSGTTTWTTDYKLVFISSSVSNEHLGSPDVIPLSKPVAPGETIDIPVSLTAPQTQGQYKVTWRLLNSQGQSVPVDGYDLWTLINVGNAQASSPVANNSSGSILQSVTASGITVNLIDVTYSEQSSSIKYCITLPDDTNWFPQDMWVSVNGQTTSVGFVLAGSKHDSSTFAAYRCYISTVESIVKTGENFSFSIGLIGKDGVSDGDCPSAQQALASQYPDLKFTCLPVTAGAFYTLIQRPQGMSDQEADRIIVDAIQKNIYGNWNFNITR